jgi:hypothetical protein
MAPLDFAAEVRRGSKELRTRLADVGGANTPETKAAARVLAKSIRKVLSKKGTRRERSQPGEPPRRQTGKAVKSIGTEIVGGVMRVGTGRFTLRILQDGNVGAAQGKAVDQAGKRRHKRRTLKRPGVTIEPRPFMEQALALALPQMEGEYVAELQKKTRTG